MSSQLSRTWAKNAPCSIRIACLSFSRNPSLRALRVLAQLLFHYGGEGALEEFIVQNIAFAIFSADDPVTAFHIDEPEIGDDCFCLYALPGIDCDRPANPK
jgi:hypothetical protein